MKDIIYLVCDNRGCARMTKKPPSMYRGEVAVKVKIEVPDSAFISPIITASLDVPEDRVILPEIDMTVDDEVPEQ